MKKAQRILAAKRAAKLRRQLAETERLLIICGVYYDVTKGGSEILIELDYHFATNTGRWHGQGHKGIGIEGLIDLLDKKGYL